MTYPVKYSIQTVSDAIDRLAAYIQPDSQTVFLVLMNGGAWFAHQLFNRFGTLPITIEYAKLSSYKGKTRGQLSFVYAPSAEFHDKHIIVLDDICDSGTTLCAVHRWLALQQPASVRFFTLLARKGRYTLDDGMSLTVGIEDDSDDFFVGCGLDDNGRARNLPYVGVVN